MMHVLTGSQKIAQDKLSEQESDKEQVNFIRISCGESVLFKFRTVFVHCMYNNKSKPLGNSTK